MSLSEASLITCNRHNKHDENANFAGTIATPKIGIFIYIFSLRFLCNLVEALLSNLNNKAHKITHLKILNLHFNSLAGSPTPNDLSENYVIEVIICATYSGHGNYSGKTGSNSYLCDQLYRHYHFYVDL